jgi:hypothetical protein
MKGLLSSSSTRILVTVTIACTLVVLIFGVPALQIARAQYGTTGGSIEEQLRLAKAKITNAQASGAYGSGTPMLGSSLSETEIDIIALVAVFGAISAAFFIMGTRGRKRAEKVA